MVTASIARFPRRITDLTDARAAGCDVHLEIAFEILPADFQHRTHPFQAYIFLARYSGAIDERPFEFRKCYARGCPNNLCTHVSQAVKIANRYLQRDYRALKAGNIQVREEALFSLGDMIVKFEKLKEKGPLTLTLPELTVLAKAGKAITVEIELEMIPAVEHFADTKNAQTFLSGQFNARAEDETYYCHRCFACFPTDQEEEQKKIAVKVANARLAVVYNDF